MSRNISLKDIASKLGVSTALVSYVLNNKKQGRISKEVARKIRETAEALGYRKNFLATSLKTNKTHTIGLIVADISNAYFSNLARVIEDEADRYGYTVIFGSSDEDLEKGRKLIDTFLSRQVDGLIMASSGDSTDQVVALQEAGIPFVLIDRYFPNMKTNYVALDNYNAALMATRHLLNEGCQRIGFVTYEHALFHMNERQRGYESALNESNIEVDPALVKKVDYACVMEDVTRSCQELLAGSKPVDGILFASNKTAVYGLKYINSLSLKVPDDLAVVSFDESDAFELFYAPVTHVRQPIQQMGQKAAQILIQTIEQETAICQVTFPAEFVPGASSKRHS